VDSIHRPRGGSREPHGERAVIPARVIYRLDTGTVSERSIDSDIPARSRDCRIISAVKRRSTTTGVITIYPIPLWIFGYEIPKFTWKDNRGRADGLAVYWRTFTLKLTTATRLEIQWSL
jgi:hypothetical protein